MTSTVARPRIEAIDWMRGVVMVLMALDHVRYFFTNLPFPPEDMDRTWLGLFLTRWVTHFCAPMFFFLAGASAYLSGRRRTSGELSRYLVTRGLWLVALELTIIGFAWNFKPGYSFAGVIWALGWSMVLLAVLSRIPAPWLAAFSLIVIAGHDALPSIDMPLWRFLHQPGPVNVFGIDYLILYPLIPWFAVMSLGYAAGTLWELSADRRRVVLIWIGSAATLLFIFLRVFNVYDNPRPFTIHDDWTMTLVSLLNVAKYPPSLQYLLMTLGPPLIGLAVVERWLDRRRGLISDGLITFGRVPMFYYLLHLYLIHIAALIVAVITRQPHQWLGWNGDQSVVPPPGYGYGLTLVYVVWLLVLVALYFPCRWFDALKQQRRAAWLRYV